MGEILDQVDADGVRLAGLHGPGHVHIIRGGGAQLAHARDINGPKQD